MGAEMTPEIKYELWKNDVIQAARELVKAGKGVGSGSTGLMALANYHDAQRRIWDVMEREPK